MKLPNGYGSVAKLSDKRRKPWMIRKTTGYRIDPSKWSEKKYENVSESNAKGYTAAYKACSILYNRVFKDLKLVDLPKVIDTCGKNYPSFKKIKVLFNQLYDFTIKKIVGHSGAMTLTEKVYANLDMQILVDAINKTLPNVP